MKSIFLIFIIKILLISGQYYNGIYPGYGGFGYGGYGGMNSLGYGMAYTNPLGGYGGYGGYGMGLNNIYGAGYDNNYWMCRQLGLYPSGYGYGYGKRK